MKRASKKEKKIITAVVLILIILVVFSFYIQKRSIYFSPEDILEPVASAMRTISENNGIVNVEIKLKLFYDCDSLILADSMLGFNIIEAESNVVFSNNLVLWYLSDLKAGNYSFYYKAEKKSNVNEIKGRIGVKIADFENSYLITGQSNIFLASENSPAYSGGSSHRNLQENLKNQSKIDFEESSQGGKISIGIGEKIFFNLEENKEYSLELESLDENSCRIIIQFPLSRANLAVGRATKLDLNGDGIYDLYLELDSIVENKAVVFLKKINEKSPDLSEIENPSNIQVNTPFFLKSILAKIFIFSALIIGILIASVLINRVYSKAKTDRLKEQ